MFGPEADEVIVQGPDFAGFIELGEGDDYLYINRNFSSDLIQGSITISGGSGTDTIVAGDNFGGVSYDGSQIILDYYDFSVRLNHSDGDTFEYLDTDGVNVSEAEDGSLDFTSNDYHAPHRLTTVTDDPTHENDGSELFMYVGTAGDDVIYAYKIDSDGAIIPSPYPGSIYAPDDIIFAGSGDDTVFANEMDMINLGDGDDTVVFDPSGGRLSGFDNAVTGGAGLTRSSSPVRSMTTQ